MHSRHFISARFAIQSLRSVKALSFAGSIVGESESPPIAAGHVPLASAGLLATEMNPSLPFDAALVASAGSSRFGTAQACEVIFLYALARRAPSANRSFKRTGLRPAA